MEKIVKKVGNISVKCDSCGADMFIFPCNLRTHKHHFCSRPCVYDYHRKNAVGESSPHWQGGAIKVKCSQCGIDIKRTMSETKDHTNHFCSRECDGKWRSENLRGAVIYNWTGGVKIPCHQCGKEMIRSESRAAAYEHHFCSRVCKGKSYQWRGGAAAGRERLKSDLRARVNSRMATSIGLALKGDKHGRKWESLVGYTANDLILHLKKTMPEGYVWTDFLSGDLEIDHIIPCAVFNYETSDDLDFKKCWDIRNLRLLYKIENRSKGKKIDKPFQPSLAMAVI
jgi:5-methylcytosine-specific restriction endonuclease McrA